MKTHRELRADELIYRPEPSIWRCRDVSDRSGVALESAVGQDCDVLLAVWTASVVAVRVANMYARGVPGDDLLRAKLLSGERDIVVDRGVGDGRQ